MKFASGRMGTMSKRTPGLRERATPSMDDNFT